MNRSLLFIAIALLLWGFGEGMFINFIPIYLDNQFHLSKPQIGLVLGVFGFSMALTHIPAGRLSDRLGRRPLLITAWLVGLTATIIMGLGRVLPLYLTGLFMYGLTSFVASPLSSYVTAARGQWPVGTALSLTTVAFNTGMTFGPITGGWIGEQFGMRASFVGASIVFAASTLFIVLIAAQPINHHDPSAPPPDLRKNRRFIAFLAVMAFAVFSMYLAVPLTPNFLESVRKLSLTQTGLVFTAGALGNAVMALLLSRSNPRYGFLVAQALVILFAIAIWKGNSLPVFALGYFLLGGFRAARPMAMAQARDLVHDSQMGLTYGAMETVNAIVFILTPPLAGLLFDWDPVFIYPLSIGLLLVSIVISYLFSPQKESHA
ncbi:MAG: MFS transporter [Anaerolineales bacterium]